MQSLTLMSRRAAALLSCSLMETITSVRVCPRTSALASSTDGALSATASSVSASSAVSEPGASACHAQQPGLAPHTLSCNSQATLSYALHHSLQHLSILMQCLCSAPAPAVHSSLCQHYTQSPGN